MQRIAAVLLLVLADSVPARPPTAPKTPEPPFPPAVVVETGGTGENPAREQWTISPTGECSLRRGWEKEPAARGKLRPAALRAFAVQMAALEITKLPPRLGLAAEQLAG